MSIIHIRDNFHRHSTYARRDSSDPLFYLHHANIDRIWWNWQQLAPATRFFSVSGPATKTTPVHEVGLDYVLHMGSLGLSVPIRDVLDLWSKPNCYTYA